MLARGCIVGDAAGLAPFLCSLPTSCRGCSQSPVFASREVPASISMPTLSPHAWLTECAQPHRRYHKITRIEQSLPWRHAATAGSIGREVLGGAANGNDASTDSATASPGFQTPTVATMPARNVGGADARTVALDRGRQQLTLAGHDVGVLNPPTTTPPAGIVSGSWNVSTTRRLVAVDTTAATRLAGVASLGHSGSPPCCRRRHTAEAAPSSTLRPSDQAAAIWQSTCRSVEGSRRGPSPKVVRRCRWCRDLAALKLQA